MFYNNQARQQDTSTTLTWTSGGGNACSVARAIVIEFGDELFTDDSNTTCETHTHTLTEAGLAHAHQQNSCSRLEHV